VSNFCAKLDRDAERFGLTLLQDSATDVKHRSLSVYALNSFSFKGVFTARTATSKHKTAAAFMEERTELFDHSREQSPRVAADLIEINSDDDQPESDRSALRIDEAMYPLRVKLQYVFSMVCDNATVRHHCIWNTLCRQILRH